MPWTICSLTEAQMLAGEPAVALEGGRGAMEPDEVLDELVDLKRGDAWLYRGARTAQGRLGDGARSLHLLDLLRSLDLNHRARRALTSA